MLYYYAQKLPWFMVMIRVTRGMETMAMETMAMERIRAMNEGKNKGVDGGKIKGDDKDKNKDNGDKIIRRRNTMMM